MTDRTLEEDISEITSEITLKEVLLQTRIINLWARGKRPHEIALATGQPVGRIFQLLRQRQKAMIEEDGGKDHEGKNDS